jgi:hypothetical protein
MLKMTRFGIVAVMVCAMVASAKADQSTPKGAALMFGNALMAGDGKALRAVSTGTEEEYKIVEALGSMVSSMKKLSDAAAEKFGKDNPLSANTKDMDVAGDLEKSEVKEEGDNATIINKEKNEKDPMKLVKKDGKWSVDLKASMPKENLGEVVKMAPAMSKAATEITAEIKAGKFKDAMEAQQAFGTKMIAAMMEAAPKAPAPAPEK